MASTLAQQQSPIEIVNGTVIPELDLLKPFVPDVYCLRLQCPESLKVTDEVLGDLLTTLKDDTDNELNFIQWTVSANINQSSKSDTSQARKTSGAQMSLANGSTSNGHSASGDSTTSDDEPDTVPEIEIDSTTFPKYFCKTMPASAPQGRPLINPDHVELVTGKTPTETVLVEMWYRPGGSHKSDKNHGVNVAGAVRKHVIDKLKATSPKYQVYILRYNLSNAMLSPTTPSKKKEKSTQTSAM